MTKYLALALLFLTFGAWAQPAPVTDTSIRHANETDKAAIFGYMINARSGEMRGNPIRSIYAQCWLPTLICLTLAPVYLRLSRRY